MKTALSLSLAAWLAGAATSQAQTPNVGAQSAAGRQQTPGRTVAVSKTLTRIEFDALLENPTKVVVIDVRRPDEVQSIGGFPVYLSIQAGELEKHLAFIPKDRNVIAVSNHAGRAGRAAELLTKNGFSVAGVIGAQDYEAQGGTLVKSAAPRSETATAATPAGARKAEVGK
jgi:rhodanese-related sulfurtransferase